MNRFSTLKGFSYGTYMGVDTLPDNVVMLFKEMLEKQMRVSETTGVGKRKVKASELDSIMEAVKSCSVENALEIIDAALSGRIDFDKDFKLFHYDKKVTTFGTMAEVSSKARHGECYINFERTDSSSDSGDRVDGLCIDDVSFSSMRTHTSSDVFSQIEEEAEIKSAAEFIMAINNDYIVDEGVDLVRLIHNALNTFPQAIEKLKEICTNNTLVGEQIELILGSGQYVDDLLPLTC